MSYSERGTFDLTDSSEVILMGLKISLIIHCAVVVGSRETSWLVSWDKNVSMIFLTGVLQNITYGLSLFLDKIRRPSCIEAISLTLSSLTLVSFDYSSIMYDITIAIAAVDRKNIKIITILETKMMSVTS